MNHTVIMATGRSFLFFLILAASTGLASPIFAAPEKEGPPRGHLRIEGVVVDKGGTLVVKGPHGETYQVNPNVSRRHGHAPFKEGDQVIALVNIDNLVIDVHPKGDEGTHRFITGKLIYVGRTKPEIKLDTSEGARVFPIERQEIKSVNIDEGTLVTVELNEAGTAIDLRRAEE